MIDERPRRLMATLESRVEALLEARVEGRVQHQALQNRLSELEQNRQALEARNAELQARAEAAQGQRDELARRIKALEATLAESEAARLELVEENRELDEQGRELEAHAQRLQARLDETVAEPPVSTHRQGLGLSALMGHHRAAAPAADEADAEEAAAVSASSDASQQAALPVEEAPSPQALLAQWYQRYGDAFFKGHTRPLKVGIHEDLSALEPWPEKLVRRALACYVNLPRYLKSVREGAERIDLEGAPAGVVDRGAAEHAHRKLERLQAERQRKGKPAKARKPRQSRTDEPSSQPKEASGAPDAASPAAARATAEPSPQDEPADDRLHRKLGELMARHNGR
ncbi:ProQ/FINO family protein [Halomonas salina]|uniref:ProQ/FINO family protein n=1 Tax=Halomonas salina TaxID=42565 RepID=UPI001F1DE348|nr:ProQ/FINO family protein [Halomonas salina]